MTNRYNRFTSATIHMAHIQAFTYMKMKMKNVTGWAPEGGLLRATSQRHTAARHTGLSCMQAAPNNPVHQPC